MTNEQIALASVYAIGVALALVAVGAYIARAPETRLRDPWPDEPEREIRVGSTVVLRNDHGVKFPMMGEVVRLAASDEIGIWVEWSNGASNNYRATELQLVSEWANG